MFPSHYFPNTAYAPRYFPKVGGTAPPAELAYQGDAYYYDSASSTGSIAGGTVLAGPNQSSPTGTVSGASVQPVPNQDSPTGSISGGTVLPTETIYD